MLQGEKSIRDHDHVLILLPISICMSHACTHVGRESCHGTKGLIIVQTSGITKVQLHGTLKHGKT